MNLQLQNHLAVIIGGASGIGLATARTFAEEGANVALWDRAQGVEQTADTLAKETSVRTIGLNVDVTDEPALRIALSKTVEHLGKVDHLVLTAATGSGKFGFPFTNLKPDDWSHVLQVNIIGMANVAHVFGPLMAERGGGTMVFLGSIAGQIGSQTDPPYSASKAANINFAQCLAKDLAGRRVRVNTVSPGMVRTPLNRGVWQAWHDQTAEAERLSYDDWASRKIKALVPLGEWQTSEAIADMIVFLSSDRASHITGQTINVDGGMVMHS